MSDLESIGLLSLVVIGLYFMFKYIESKDRSEKENAQLYKYSDKAIKLIREQKEGIISVDVQKQLDAIMNNPEERQAAIKRAQVGEERKKAQEEERLQEVKINRKVGYKYDEKIFSIFNGAQELLRAEFLVRIQLSFDVKIEEAEKLLKLWERHSLISTCYWDNNAYMIGYILERDCLLENDLTYSTWLANNNKILEPPTKKHQAYLDDSQLPF